MSPAVDIGSVQKQDRKGPQLGQLASQCRSAATRGDCAAALVIAQQIASQDAGYYRDHVANDASIRKCLASE